MKYKILGLFLSMALVSSGVLAQSMNGNDVEISNNVPGTDTSMQMEVMTGDKGDAYQDPKRGYEYNHMGENKKAQGFIFGLVALVAFIFLLASALFIFWIITLIHAITKPIENRGMWIVLMIFTGVIGSILYYFLEMREFNKKAMQNVSATPQSKDTNTSTGEAKNDAELGN